VKRAPKFNTEADLCAAFIAWAKGEAGRHSYGVQCPAWTPYAETAGWDILLVGTDGTQIGIQAKQRFNLKVLEQAVPHCWDAWRDEGPDYRAVLVPDRDRDAAELCGALGLMLFAPAGQWYDDDARGIGVAFSPGLNMDHASGGWHYWSPRTRCPLPEYVPDVVAGASGPVQLTKWKVQALRLMAVLEIRGHVTRQDFRTLGIDPRRWLGPQGWLLSDPARPGEFMRGAGLDFDQQHPAVYAQVLEETRTREIVA
jgi:hypothetical protein